MPEVRLGGKLCLAHNPAYSPGQGQATSYYNPLGPGPGVGYVWMLATDADTLDLEQPQALTIDATETITLPRLYIDSAIAASGLFPGDSARAYLLTLRDSRFILDRQTDVNLGINCRAAAAPTNSTAASDPNEFYQSTLNPLTGAPYEWSDAIGFLWSFCPAGLVGAFPGLPYLPEGVPQNLRFAGVSAWRALHELLGRVKLTTAYDAAADKFAIIDLAEPQPSLAAVASYAGRVLNDRFPGGSVKTRVPAAIRVYFQRQAQHFGTEPDSPRANNWQDFGGQYWIDIPTGAAAEPGTVMGLHDDAPAIVDFNGVVLNDGELLARANDRAAQWTAAKILEVARGSLIIQGIAAPLATPGSQVSGVLLRNFGDGWMTELALTPNQASGVRRQELGGDENFFPPDLARRTLPLYPRVTQLVMATSGQRDSNGLYAAVVVRANPAANFTGEPGVVTPYSSLEPCLLADAAGLTLANSKVYVSRLNGVAYSNGAYLPLYITHAAGKPVLGKTVSAIVNNSFSGNPADYTPEDNVYVYSVPPGDNQGEETATGDYIQAFNHFFGFIPENTWVLCQDDGDGYYVSQVIQGNHLVGIVPYTSGLSGSSIAIHFPAAGAGTFTEIDVQLQVTEPADQSVLSIESEAPTIKAAVRHWPVLDGEQVTVAWTGGIFTVIASDFQTGIACYNAGSQISKGNAFADGQLAVSIKGASPVGGPTLAQTNNLIFSRLGDFPAAKEGWLSWNHFGGYAIAAEC